MPPIPVQGQPKRSGTVLVQPPPEPLPEQLTNSEAEPEPEPAIPIADIPRPTQAELAATSLAQQNVNKRNEMTPSSSLEQPAYQFTDADREKAIEARKSKRYPWADADLQDALVYLAEIRAECERGGLLLQKRVSELKVERVKCYSCSNLINISEGRWNSMRTRNNFETGIPESSYSCSSACTLKMNREFTHPTRNAAIPMEREAGA